MVQAYIRRGCLHILTGEGGRPEFNPVPREEQRENGYDDAPPINYDVSIRTMPIFFFRRVRNGIDGGDIYRVAL